MAVGDSSVCFVFFAVGNGGGGIADGSGTTLEVDIVVPPLDSLSSARGGEANLAVCRGPEGPGALCFLRIGCGGGGLDEDGVGAFILIIPSWPSALFSSGCCVGAEPFSCAMICSRRALDLCGNISFNPITCQETYPPLVFHDFFLGPQEAHLLVRLRCLGKSWQEWDRIVSSYCCPKHATKSSPGVGELDRHRVS